MNDIKLYLGGRLADLDNAPGILFNYKETDLTNPTVVKNSYTKTITLPSTNNNNDIFGAIFDLSRIQTYVDGSYSGVAFNPLVKTSFELLVNECIFEKGYFKLDSITKRGNNYTYSVVLYGGLGSFFFNLSYRHGADGQADGINKMTLADLNYDYEGDLGFVINKNTVWDAWQQVMGCPYAYRTEAELAAAGGRGNHDGFKPYLLDRKWDIINFAPAYNGIPGDFSANKVLINNYQLYGGILPTVRDGYRCVGYSGAPLVGAGFSLGEMDEDLTEWQTFDLRTYLQRPCIRLKEVIDACCDPSNNGGFEVKLDSHFFNSGGNPNPYYEDTWITLPMLRDMEIIPTRESGSSEGITATLGERKNNSIPVTINGADTLSDYNNLNMSVVVKFTPDNASESDDLLYSFFHYEGQGVHTKKTYVKDDYCNGGFVLQMEALDIEGNIVGVSDAYGFCYNEKVPKQFKSPLFKNYKPTSDAPLRIMKGHFKLVSGEYVWVDENEKEVAINFTLNAPNNFTTIRLRTFQPYSYYHKYHGAGTGNGADTDYLNYGYMFRQTSLSNEKKTLEWIYQNYRVSGAYGVEIVDFSLSSFDYEALFSGSTVPMNKLLNTEGSPCDYLLSFAKMFGLYFYKDPMEDSTDFDLYPEGVIHIVDRDTFYKFDEGVIDINDRIDRGKDIVVSPRLADKKWYTMNTEQVESEANNEYQTNYGNDYGQQRINTGYNFDSESKELLENNIFKGAVMVQEKDKYFNLPYPTGEPVYVHNGLTVTLYKAGDEGLDSADYEIPLQVMPRDGYLNNKELERYDARPRPQFHTEENEAGDGENVLLFYNKPSFDYPDSNANYWLTDDDIPAMASLNEGEPCWVLTNSEMSFDGHRIAYKMDDIPNFTRWRYYDASKKIVSSLDMGTPQVLYVPDIYVTDGMSIYDKTWRDYVSDLYNVDTRKVSCYVRLEQQPTVDMMRRLYWFDSAIWRLNGIIDWDVSKLDTTKCEFIKVNDPENYKLKTINNNGTFGIRMDEVEISGNEQRVHGAMWAQNGMYLGFQQSICNIEGEGCLDSEEVCHPYSGIGEFEFYVEFPENTSGEDKVWEVAIEPDDTRPDYYYVLVRQGTWQMTWFSSAATFLPSGTSTYTGFQFVNLSGCTVTSSADWVRVTNVVPNLGRCFYTVLPNPGDARTATLTLSGYDHNMRQHTDVLEIFQLANTAVWDLDIEEESVDFDYEADDTAVDYTAEGLTNLSVTVTEGDDWITATLTGNQTINIVVDNNPGITDRTGTVRLQGTDSNNCVRYDEITVHQGHIDYALRFEVDNPDNVYIHGQIDDEQTILVHYDNMFADSFILEYPVGWVESAEWEVIDGNTVEVTLSTTTNDTGRERTGTLKIWASPISGIYVSDEIRLVQGVKNWEVKKFNLNTLNKRYGAFNGQTPVKHTELFDWGVTSDEDWLTADFNGTLLTYSATANASSEPRTAHIVATAYDADGNIHTFTKTVNQGGYTWTLEINDKSQARHEPAPFEERRTFTAEGLTNLRVEAEHILGWRDLHEDGWITARIEGNEIVINGTEDLFPPTVLSHLESSRKYRITLYGTDLNGVEHSDSYDDWQKDYPYPQWHIDGNKIEFPYNDSGEDIWYPGGLISTYSYDSSTAQLIPLLQPLKDVKIEPLNEPVVIDGYTYYQEVYFKLGRAFEDRNSTLYLYLGSTLYPEAELTYLHKDVHYYYPGE